MKNAPENKAIERAAGTANYTPGRLPKRQNTVTAAVLASLLSSQVMTGMESVFKQSTTRLGAVIHYLENKYGWHIERRDIATGTKDGRVTYISAYWLPQKTLAKAFEVGVRSWIDSVREKRAKRRKLSGKCKKQAARINAARKIDLRQIDFWEER